MPAGARRKLRKTAAAIDQNPKINHPLSHFLLIGVLAVTPLAMLTGVFLSHDVAPKVLAILCGSAALLFLLPQWLSGLGLLIRNRVGVIFLFLLCAQFASLLLSTSASGNLSLSIAGTLWRRFGLIEQTALLVLACATACAVAIQPSLVKVLYRAIGICGGLAGIYAIAQYFGLDPFLDRSLYAVDYFGSVARPPATMGHALYFAAYEVSVVFLCPGAWLYEKEIVWKRIFLAGILAGVAAIVLSGTRSALLALALGFGYFIARRPQTAHSITNGKLMLTAAALLVSFGVFVLSPAGSNLRHRIGQWPHEFGGPRLEMWRESPALLQGHLFTGIGPETFGGAFRRIQSAGLSREFPEFYQETPHNAFIDALCAQGLPGLLILLGVAVLPWAANRPDGSHRLGIECAMLGLIVCSVFASFTLITALYFWLLAALSAGIGAHKSSPVKLPQCPLWPRVPAAIAACLFVLIGASLALQDYEWSELAYAVADKDLKRATDSFSAAETASPGLPGYELFASREFATLGRALGTSAGSAASWKLAAEASAIAEAGGEEAFNAAYQSSVLAVAGTDLTKAESEARKAVQLAPNWYKAHLLLAQILQIRGNTAEAANEAAISATLGWKADAK